MCIIEECPICLSDFSTLKTTLKCGHVYCEMCIAIWEESNSTCPMCRMAIECEYAVWFKENKTILFGPKNLEEKLENALHVHTIYTKQEQLICIATLVGSAIYKATMTLKDHILCDAYRINGETIVVDIQNIKWGGTSISDKLYIKEARVAFK